VSRISVCINDAASTILITSLSGKAALEQYSASGDQPPLPANLLVTTPEELLRGEEEEGAAEKYTSPRLRGLTADGTAYVIYTSGSTGIPKGIAITNRNAVHYLLSAVHIYKPKAKDVILQMASVAFDLSVEEVWLLLTVGGLLYVASPQEVLDIDRLPFLLQREGVTIVDTVPTLLAIMSAASSSSSLTLPRLRIIILGGEALPMSLLQQWAAPGRRIFNTYGPTETTIVATTWLCDTKSREVAIGVPIPNYICYVVDPDTLQLVPPGVQGELLIGGVGVAKGYHRRPELTADKFIPNPFPSDKERYPVLYRTGDASVVTIDTNQLVFRGRLDDQVKVRGFRVELGEIEAHMDRLGGQHGLKRGQVAVVLKPASDSSAETLVAFVVLESSSSSSSS
jgi:amino acid adenylation domain-containing protein